MGYVELEKNVKRRDGMSKTHTISFCMQQLLSLTKTTPKGRE